MDWFIFGAAIICGAIIFTLGWVQGYRAADKRERWR